MADVWFSINKDLNQTVDLGPGSIRHCCRAPTLSLVDVSTNAGNGDTVLVNAQDVAQAGPDGPGGQ
jgi:hypothetical protein